MERREAPVSFKRGHGKTEDWCAAWRSIPLGISEGWKACPREGGEDYGLPGAAKNTGDDACSLEIWLFEI